VISKRQIAFESPAIVNGGISHVFFQDYGVQEAQADEKAQFRLRRGELILKEVCNTTTGARWGFEPLLNRKLV
jgi:hypothetical protein